MLFRKPSGCARTTYKMVSRKAQLTDTGYWDRVVFSDESKVDIGLFGGVYICRKVGEEWLPECTAPPQRK